MESAPAASPATRFLSYTARAQGVYYAVTGFWPLVSMGTFQLVTGRKRDLWLVQTAGALIGVIGCVLTLAGWRRRLTAEMPALAIGTALSLGAVDVVYVRRRVIRPIYLGDALVEMALIALWAFGLRYRRSEGAD